MNKNLKVGIRSGFAFGLAMGFFGYFQTGRPITALINASSGLFFGAFMAWLSSRGEHRLKARGFDATDLNPVQVRKVSYPGSTQETLEVARQALKTLHRLKSVSEGATPLSLQAKMGFSSESFGESVLVTLTAGTNGTDIEISSKPGLSTTVTDMGRGVENVETVARFLEAKGATRIAPVSIAR